MFAVDQIEIPPEWEKLPFDKMSGMVMVVGAPDVGKTTLAKYLFWRLNQDFEHVAFLDGDPGQSTLGPPTTFTLSVSDKIGGRFPPANRLRRIFIGSVSPRGHMLRVIVGAARLTQVAVENDVRAIIYDTSGFIDSLRGGHALKQAKIDLLHPAYLVAIQKEDELERFVSPLRMSQRVRVIVMKPSLAVRKRNLSARQIYRSEHFRQYFANARRLEMNWDRFPVIPYPRFMLNRLLAFEDMDGFVLSLGIIEKIERVSRTISIVTSLPSLAKVNTIHLGDVLIDRETFQDRRMEAN